MAIRDLIGREFPAFEMPIERGKIKEFAVAIGDENPIYHDQNYAAQSSFGANLAPPTFTVTKEFWRKGPTIWEMTGLDPQFRLHGEEEYEYLAPIVAGDVLTCHSKIVDAYERAGKGGRKMVFVVHEYVFHNQKGEKALVSRRTTIFLEGAVEK